MADKNRAIKMVTIDMEGYGITEDIKKVITNRIATNSKLQKFEYLLNTKNRIYNAGIQTFTLNMNYSDSIGSITYGNSYNLFLFDPAMFDKEIGEKMYFQRTKTSMLKRMGTPIIAGKDLNHQIKQRIDSEKVSAICGYGEGEKKYLQEIGFKFIDRLITDLSTIDQHSPREYYYIDMEKINEMMVRNDILENGKLARGLENNKAYSDSYEFYSVKAEKIHQALITVFTDTSEVDRFIKTQIHLGKEDSKLQTSILESLFIYEKSKTGTKLLFNVFNSVNPMGEIKLLYEKGSLSKSTIKRKTVNLSFLFKDEVLVYSKAEATQRENLKSLVGSNYDKIKITERDDFGTIVQNMYADFDKNAKYSSQVNIDTTTTKPKRTLSLKEIQQKILTSNIVKLYNLESRKMILITINDIQILGKIPYSLINKEKFDSLYYLFENKTKLESFIPEKINNIKDYFLTTKDNIKPLEEILKVLYKKYKINAKIENTESKTAETTSVKDTLDKLIPPVKKTRTSKAEKLQTTINQINLKKFVDKDDFIALLILFYAVNDLTKKNDMFTAFTKVKKDINAKKKMKMSYQKGTQTKNFFSKNFETMLDYFSQTTEVKRKKVFIAPLNNFSIDGVMDCLYSKDQQKFIKNKKSDKYVTFYY